jgi:hypothetical protein
VTTTTKTALKRVYAIKSKPEGKIVALIKAISSAQALAHHLKPILDIESASQDDMQTGYENGLRVQTAGETIAPPVISAPPADLPLAETPAPDDLLANV